MSDHVLPRYTKPHVKISHGFVNVGKALIPREAVVHVYEFVARSLVAACKLFLMYLQCKKQNRD